MHVIGDILNYLHIYLTTNTVQARVSLRKFRKPIIGRSIKYGVYVYTDGTCRWTALIVIRGMEGIYYELLEIRIVAVAFKCMNRREPE